MPINQKSLKLQKQLGSTNQVTSSAKKNENRTTVLTGDLDPPPFWETGVSSRGRDLPPPPGTGNHLLGVTGPARGPQDPPRGK